MESKKRDSSKSISGMLEGIAVSDPRTKVKRSQATLRALERGRRAARSARRKTRVTSPTDTLDRVETAGRSKKNKVATPAVRKLVEASDAMALALDPWAEQMRRHGIAIRRLFRRW